MHNNIKYTHGNNNNNGKLRQREKKYEKLVHNMG